MTVATMATRKAVPMAHYSRAATKVGTMAPQKVVSMADPRAATKVATMPSQHSLWTETSIHEISTESSSYFTEVRWWNSRFLRPVIASRI
jgi:hypothetical protein